MLSASDVETYRSCPLRYKFARVLKIPTEQTLSQRFGIVVHQVLERFHSAEAEPQRDGEQEPGTLEELLGLLDAAWRRAGLGEGGQERELRGKARSALRRYHERLREEPRSRCGSSARSRSTWALTTCGGGWTAWIACRAGCTS